MRFFTELLLGNGKLKPELRSTLESEGLVILEEGLPGSVRYKHFKAPGKRFHGKVTLQRIGLGISKERIVVYCRSGRAKLINTPFSDPRLSALEVSLDGKDTVAIRIDYSRVNVPNVSGEITITAKTPKAPTIVEQLRRDWADEFLDQPQSESADNRWMRSEDAMRKLSVNTFLTLDGVMQAPGGPEEDPSGGFAFGGWSVNYWDDKMGELMDDYMGKPFDLVLGRKTYEIFAAYWPNASEEQGPAKALNDGTKNVASRTLESPLEWANSVLIEGDVVEGVSALKEQDGPELQIHGSGDLIQSLLPHNVIDEFRVWVFPLVVGTGKRLFADGTVPGGLKLVDSTISTTGVMVGTYVPAGEIQTGSF